VSGNAKVEAFAETDVMAGMMEFEFEVDEIDVHLHGHLQTKERLLIRAALLLLLNVLYWFIVGLDVSRNMSEHTSGH
jgi:hypothetical protein